MPANLAILPQLHGFVSVERIVQVCLVDRSEFNTRGVDPFNIPHILDKDWNQILAVRRVGPIDDVGPLGPFLLHIGRHLAVALHKPQQRFEASSRQNTVGNVTAPCVNRWAQAYLEPPLFVDGKEKVDGVEPLQVKCKQKQVRNWC